MYCGYIESDFVEQNCRLWQVIFNLISKTNHTLFLPNKKVHLHQQPHPAETFTFCINLTLNLTPFVRIEI